MRRRARLLMGFNRALASGALAGAFCAARAVALRAGGDQQYMQRGNIFETPVLLLAFALLALYFPHAVIGAPMGALRALHRAATSREQAAPRRRVLFVLKGLLAFCVLGFAMQESYYRMGHCATSTFYNEQNGLIFKTTADVLTRAGAAWYLDRASLLACLRHQALLPWDADSDVGVLLPPGEEQATIARLKAALEGTRLRGARVPVRHHAARAATCCRCTRIAASRSTRRRTSTSGSTAAPSWTAKCSGRTATTTRTTCAAPSARSCPSATARGWARTAPCRRVRTTSAASSSEPPT
jgi:hypothetical protein